MRLHVRNNRLMMITENRCYCKESYKSHKYTVMANLTVLMGNQVVQVATNVKVKGKVHRCTGTEALYRPYGP